MFHIIEEGEINHYGINIRKNQNSILVLIINIPLWKTLPSAYLSNYCGNY